MNIKVVLEPSEDGGYTVCVPSLPGCISEGDTIEEALTNIQEAIELYLESVEDEFPMSKGAIVKELAFVDVSSNRFFKKAPRPSYSRIKIERSSEELTVYLPAGSFRKLKQKFGIICLTAFLSYYYTVEYPLTVEFQNLPIFLIIFTYILIVFTRFISEQSYLYMGKESLVLLRKFMWIKYKKESGKISEILGVFLNKNDGLHQVSIYSHRKTYYLGGALSQEECAWLAEEIQDWLRQW